MRQVQDPGQPVPAAKRRCTAAAGRASRPLYVRSATARRTAAWLLAVPLEPKPVLSFDYQGDYDLVFDLLDCPMPGGWKYEHVGATLDVERLEMYFRKYGDRHHALHDARAN